jgi:hypothetical protein
LHPFEIVNVALTDPVQFPSDLEQCLAIRLADVSGRIYLRPQSTALAFWKGMAGAEKDSGDVRQHPGVFGAKQPFVLPMVVAEPVFIRVDKIPGPVRWRANLICTMMRVTLLYRVCWCVCRFGNVEAGDSKVPN